MKGRPVGYHGNWKSAARRARRVLKAAGVPLYRVVGRYSPYGGAQKVEPGANVSRLGCSDAISLHARSSASSYYSATIAQADRELFARALAALRADGLAFDDRGFLECEGD